MENYIVINGKKAELTQDQIKALGIELKEDPFDIGDFDAVYYIGRDCEVNQVCPNKEFLKLLQKCGNACKDYQMMKQRALHEKLSRLLWRFSMKNDGKMIDWENGDRSKYYLAKAVTIEVFEEGYNRIEGIVYFNSQEIAERAIEEIIVPFTNKNPDFIW